MTGYRITSMGQTLLGISRMSPDAVAVVDIDGREHSYAAFVADSVRFAVALEVIGVRPGQRVGLQVPDCRVHLLMILACQTLGAVTLSLSEAELRHENGPVQDCDLLVHGEATGVVPPVPSHRATDAWLRAVGGIAVAAGELSRLERGVPPDRVMRIIKTSGTTGAVKTIALRAGVQLERQRLNCMWNSAEGRIRQLNLYNFEFEGAVTRSLAVLGQGGLLVFSHLAAFWHDVARWNCNATTMLVGDAETLLRACPPSWSRPARFVLSIGGAALPAPLRQQLLARLATEIQCSYSSNETGLVTMIDPQGVGEILPGVSVAIRDETGGSVAIGREGLISIRSPALPDGYLNHPELTLRQFGDGWFHSNDWGYQPDPDHLVVLGRADSLLNIGGRKVPAEQVEAVLRNLPGVADAAMVSFPGALGIEQLAAMLERRPDAEPAALEKVAAALSRQYGACLVAITDRLPRTETGKVRKPEVVDWFRTRFEASGV